MDSVTRAEGLAGRGGKAHPETCLAWGSKGPAYK
jgi:hypothetical protein